MLDIRKQFCPLGFWTAKKIHISQDLSRKNYLAKTIKPFYGVISDLDGINIIELSTLLYYFYLIFSRLDDENLPPLSTIEQRSLAILQQLPFLIAFNTRVLLLRDLCRFSLGENDYQRMHHDFVADNVIVIRRTHLYEDAFEKLSIKNGILNITFVNTI